MSIKSQNFDSKFNDSSLNSNKYEANRSPSAYIQKQQTRILYLISFLTIMNGAVCMALSSYILSQSLGKVDDKKMWNSFGGLIIYNTFVSACAGVLWGFISDRVGRKVVLNICLIGSALAMALFGFCKSSNSLYFINTLDGIFGCKAILIKTMIGEANDRISRPNALRYLPIIKMISGILGNMISAPFVFSQVNDIDFDKGTTSIDGSPYLIPSLIASGISIVAYILSYYCLTETLNNSRSISDEPVIVDKSTDKTMTLPISKKISIFGLNLSRNSVLLLILLTLLCTIDSPSTGISQDWLVTDSSKGGLNLKPEHILVLAPLSPIITVTILLKYPYIVKRFGVLKQFKGSFIAFGALYIFSVILTLIAKIGSTFITLFLSAILFSIESGISTMKDISFDLLLIESAEVSGNLATLYGISNILPGISGIFSGIILALPYLFKQLTAFSTENIFPFSLNCIISWFLVILSLIGYWISSKIEITPQKNQEISREHEI